MKTVADLVNDLDVLPYTPDAVEKFYLFKIEGFSETFGYLVWTTVHAFEWSDHWIVDHDNRTVTLLGQDLEERTQRMKLTLAQQWSNQTFFTKSNWSGEDCAVYDSRQEVVVCIERHACALFGVITYGCQLLAFDKFEGSYRIWVAKRSSSKKSYPGMLDCTVEGSLSYGLDPRKYMIKKSVADASFPQPLTGPLLTDCGALSYIKITDNQAVEGAGHVQPQVQYIYELQTPNFIAPKPSFQEATSMTPMSETQIKKALEEERFTPIAACVILDFFVRHGVLKYEDEESYLPMQSRLHRRLPFPTA